METHDHSTSLAKQAYQQLYHEILTCVLTPGQVVSERELAQRYGISKTPVREALAKICHDGFMQRLPGRGYMVTPITIKDIQELFDLRLILEVATAERVAQNPTPDLLNKLKAMSDVSYDLDDPESQINFLKTNRDFHLTMARAAGNRRLVATLEELFNQMERLFHLGLRLRDSSQEMVREHHEVVKALDARDAARTREVITQQILTSRDRILEAILQGELHSIQIGS